MQVTQNPFCKLNVTVLNSTSSGGHKVKLLGLVVMEVGSYDFGAGDFHKDDQTR